MIILGKILGQILISRPLIELAGVKLGFAREFYQKIGVI